jgi:hypothetical protein
MTNCAKGQPYKTSRTRCKYVHVSSCANVLLAKVLEPLQALAPTSCWRRSWNPYRATLLDKPVQATLLSQVQH